MTVESSPVTRIEFLEELNQIGLAPHVSGEPGATITRVEAAVLLAESLPHLNLGFAGGTPAPFQDLNLLSPTEQQAVSKLYHLGILLGDGQGHVHGQDALTREELGALLERTEARLQALQSLKALKAGDKTPQQEMPVGVFTSYEVVTDYSTLPSRIQDIAHSVQAAPGSMVVDSDDATYLILSAGERFTGGYAVTVTSVKETPTRLEVTVQLLKPSSGSFVIQAITYPQIVVKFAKTVKPIVVLNQEELSS